MKTFLLFCFAIWILAKLWPNKWKRSSEHIEQGNGIQETRRAEAKKPRIYNTWNKAFTREIPDDLRFQIEYSDENGEVTEREIRPISIHLIRKSHIFYISAFCYLRNEERTFRNDRILNARNLKTNRSIIDLGQYLRNRC